MLYVPSCMILVKMILQQLVVHLYISLLTSFGGFFLTVADCFSDLLWRLGLIFVLAMSDVCLPLDRLQ
jgi:hypothetical protein